MLTELEAHSLADASAANNEEKLGRVESALRRQAEYQSRYGTPPTLEYYYGTHFVTGNRVFLVDEVFTILCEDRLDPWDCLSEVRDLFGDDEADELERYCH